MVPHILQSEASSGEHFVEEGETTWNESEKLVVAPGLGLIKTARTALKKVATAIKANVQLSWSNPLMPQVVASLDQVEEVTQSFSSVVDDFSLTLYPEIDTDDVIAQVCCHQLSICHDARIIAE